MGRRIFNDTSRSNSMRLGSETQDISRPRQAVIGEDLHCVEPNSIVMICSPRPSPHGIPRFHSAQNRRM
jgi:hypothetical protein